MIPGMVGKNIGIWLNEGSFRSSTTANIIYGVMNYSSLTLTIVLYDTRRLAAIGQSRIPAAPNA